MTKQHIKFFLQNVILKSLFLLLLPLRLCRRGKWIVIYRPDHLGDVICSLPAFRELLQYARKHHYRVLFIVAPEYAWILQPFINPEEDLVFPVRRFQTYSSRIYAIRYFLKIYTFRIKKIIDFVYLDATGYLTAFAFAEESFYLDFPMPNKPAWLLFYESQFSKKLPVKIQDPIFKMYTKYISFVTEEKEMDKVSMPDFRVCFPNIGCNPPISTPYFLVFPGASVFCHCWDPVRFAEVCDSIFSYDSQIAAVIMGSKMDVKLEQIIFEHSRYPDRIIRMCGKTSLPECFSWMRNAQFMLGNDSGGGHLAACYHIPSFLIVHGADFGNYMPNTIYGNATFIFHKRDCFVCKGNCPDIVQDQECSVRLPCLDDIVPEDVFRIIKEKIRFS